jgi:hypothetical protein
MLRAQVFEGLFTLVPILLVAVVSIALRARATRRRRQREEEARSTQARGTPTQDAPARGERTQTTGGSIPTKGAQGPARGAPARGAQFPGQRLTAEAYLRSADKSGPSLAPFTPQQPRRTQVPARASNAYPPPLSLNDLKSPPGGGIQPAGTQIPRPAVEPLTESRKPFDRLAFDRATILPDGTRRVPIPRGRRTAVPEEEGDLRARMEARAKADRGPLVAPAEKRRSITAKLERLPPLKRAVIWAEILGPPGGQQ